MTKQEAITKGLYYSLHSFSDAKSRWQQRRDLGLGDAELQLAIAYEFGIEGSAAMSGLWYSYKGGQNPKFILEQWPDMPFDQKQIVMHGRQLINSVRQLLNISDKSGQLSLFEGIV